MPGVELTRHNFAEHLPDIKKKIDQCVFVSIDLEFTGLNLGQQTKSSLFDTAEQRYAKSRKNVQQFTVAQFGLTAFQSVGINRYEANVYSFYLFPETLPGIDTMLTMQASAVQFLTQYNFNFNKMLHEGIPYVNQERKEMVRNYWKTHASRPDEFDGTRDVIRNYTVHLARWVVQAKDGDIFTMEKTPERGEIPNEILHRRLIHMMMNIWPKPSRDEVLIVEKVSTEKRKELVKTSCQFADDKEKLVEQSVGFTAVIDYLISKKKTIVGHNFYLDLLFIYDKFINPLPENYTEYKTVLHSSFPSIFDTKYMCLNLRRKFDGTPHEFDSTSLSGLYTNMDGTDKKVCLLYGPDVSIANSDDGSSSIQGQIHDAGYDSYMCGYVFLRLAHLIKLDSNSEVFAGHPIPYYDYSAHLSPMENKVNLIRATQHNICLDGPDPPSVRPGELFVTTRKYNMHLNINEVSLLLSSYGAVDINRIARNQAIVGVGNFACSRRILDAFQSHEKFKVVKYSPYRHSPIAKRILWAGLALTAGICTMALIRNVRKRWYP